MKELLILVGAPGCGKTTYSTDRPHKRISQDDQGKEGHMQEFLKALDYQEYILVDRMNFNAKQRAKYIEPAKEKNFRIKVVVFDPSTFTFNFCFKRCIDRKGHPTIDNNDYHTIASALNHFFKGFEWPLNGEGIDEVEVIR